MKTLQRHDYWQSLVYENRFIYSLLAILIIFVMLADFLSLIIMSTISYMAYLEFRKRMSTYSFTKQRFIIGGILITIVVFLTLFVLGITSFLSTLNHVPEAANKNNLMNHFVSVLNPIKNFLTGFASYFLDNQEAVSLVETKISEAIAKSAEFLVSSFLFVMASFPEMLLGFFIFLVSIWIVSKSYKTSKFKIFMHTQSAEARTRLKTIFHLMELSAYDAMVSTFVVAITQGAIIALGALISGIDLWPVYFIFAFAFSFVPVVGLLPIVMVGCLHAYFLSGLGSVAIFAIFGVLASTMDNLLRLLLLSQANTMINPFISFFCLIGSLSLFGLKGLILGPFLLSFSGYLLKTSSQSNSEQIK